MDCEADSNLRMLDLEKLRATPVQIDPCRYVHVPCFVRAESLVEINRDYPDICNRGNLPPEGLTFGPAFETLLTELASAQLKSAFSEKFGLDLSTHPQQLTVRKYVDETDSGLHNDSKTKVVTVLIYFNSEWTHAGGKLRLTRNGRDFANYTIECEPKDGNLLAFVRSSTSFHGFLPCNAERRSIQMYWVRPKRLHRDPASTGSVLRGIKRLLKRG